MRRFCVITGQCNKDMLCVRACVRKAIHPLPGEAGFAEASQLFINPGRCLGCGACMGACKIGAIFPVEELPDSQRTFAEINAAYYH